MISLMPMNIEKIKAKKEGFNYIVFKDRESNAITEGASSNIFIVTKQNQILTHPIGNKVLSGCTRKLTIKILKEKGFDVAEKEFFEEDLFSAKEAFLTGAIKLFAPIKSIDSKIIGDGEFKITQLCTNEYKTFIDTFPKIIWLKSY